jgi:hypothetical protein
MPPIKPVPVELPPDGRTGNKQFLFENLETIDAHPGKWFRIYETDNRNRAGSTAARYAKHLGAGYEVVSRSKPAPAVYVRRVTPAPKKGTRA